MDDNWFPRLIEAIEADPRSKRAISQAAGLGPNFVQQMIKNGKEPGAANLQALVRVLGTVKMFYIMTGIEVSPEDEDFLRSALAAPPRLRTRIQHLLEEVSSADDGPLPSDHR